jgi:hypothetical protein
MSTRRNTAEPWGAPENLGPTVNSASDDGQPCIAADGLTLIFASTRPGGRGSWDLWVSTRPRIGEPWGTPANLGPTVNDGVQDRFPSLSADGLTLVFASDRGCGQGWHDLWMSTRRSTGEPWGRPVNLGAAINSAHVETGSALSADSRMLYFDSTRPGGQGGRDLWQAPLLPPGP